MKLPPESTESRRFIYMNYTDQLILVYKTLQYKQVNVVREVARSLGIDWDTAMRRLNALTNLGLTEHMKVSRFHYFKIKKRDKQFCLRKHLEVKLKEWFQ